MPGRVRNTGYRLPVLCARTPGLEHTLDCIVLLRESSRSRHRTGAQHCQRDDLLLLVLRQLPGDAFERRVRNRIGLFVVRVAIAADFGQTCRLAAASCLSSLGKSFFGAIVLWGSRLRSRLGFIQLYR